MFRNSGGYKMSAIRLPIILGLAAIVLALIINIGCSPDRTGTATPNSAPQVFIVNTPPDSAQFSRNPELNWYATDIDGYIAFFRFAVIIDTNLILNGQLVAPEIFIEQATDADFGWDTLEVTLDRPQSTATIRLYGDTLDPVNVFTKQYFFVQAEDDQGALSEIQYRMYSRNNNYPNTHIGGGTTFINAIDANSPAPGVRMSWWGADSTDWGRADPPLEYEWRLYGPFDVNDDVIVNLVEENCTYDPTTNSYINCEEVHVLDLTTIPDTIYVNVGTAQNPQYIGKAQPVIRSRGPNYAIDKSDVWVTDRETRLYNVFEGLDLALSNRFKFIFWVRCRDDGFVPDPSPSFGQFYLYEAKFERNVLLFDESGYTSTDGRWHPKAMDTTKAVYYNLIQNAGFTSFDTLQSGKDFFNRSAYGGPTLNYIGVKKPNLVDLLSHKIIVYNADYASGGLDESGAGALNGNGGFGIYFALDMGASGVVFARNIGNVPEGESEPYARYEMSLNFRQRFGIIATNIEPWLYYVVSRDYIMNPLFTEEFIGVYSNHGDYPSIDLSYGEGSLQDKRYLRWLFSPNYILDGSPEIGVCEKTQYAAPLYLYLSKYGDESRFHGKVCAVRQQIGDMRTAAFLFTPLAMDPEPMQETFSTTMDWLYEKFAADESATSQSSSGPQSSYSDIAERRERINQFLYYLDNFATPEEREMYGVNIRPVVVKQ
ncbi:MAG: hypothetical protein ABIE07_04840 [Candidatus Zixiibacteriota bacterium]